MLRRGFLKQFLTFSVLSVVPFRLFFSKRKLGIQIQDPNLDYLNGFKSFSELNALFVENGINAHMCVDREPSKTSHKKIHLAVLNSSYGRIANFNFENLKTSLKSDPSLISDQIFIKTEGPSGKLLSQKSAWNIIGKSLRSDKKNVFFVGDAYPHFYNFKLLSKFGASGSYFMDKVSRKPLYLSLQIQNGENKIGELKSKISYLQKSLQSDFTNFENRSIASISKKLKTYSFEDLLALEHSQKDIQGLNLKT